MTLQLHPIDIAIILGYLLLVIGIGVWISKRASQNMDAYFLGGKSLPWWVIGTSHGASGFDITGTMWFVSMVFTYGLKAAFTPWIWPLFDRVFRQMYLGAWIRKSNVLTGAEWMKTRFGTGLAGNLSHISVVVYALIASIAFLAYAFEGIGKFAEVFFPWDLATGSFSSADMYALAILGLTTAYLLLGGWYSVVLTDLVQFVLLTIASVFIAWLAMSRVSAEMLQARVPEGWFDLLPPWQLAMRWSGRIDATRHQNVRLRDRRRRWLFVLWCCDHDDAVARISGQHGGADTRLRHAAPVVDAQRAGSRTRKLVDVDRTVDSPIIDDCGDHRFGDRLL